MADPSPQDELAREIRRRRSFAIISHPDAGKTTLTEKLLLFGGALREAGAVRARRASRHATSDWLELERQRGISVSSSVMHFDYRGFRVNILDTPGHRDFSEDTYRTLMAVDSAVMVLDSVKGIEPQTLKLFEVCRTRGLPILTFINKLDQEGRAPLDLLDEIERVLGITAVPMNWPIGQGSRFQGVYARDRQEVLRFQRTERNERRAPVVAVPLHDARLVDELGDEAAGALRDDVALLDTASHAFDREDFLKERSTPVFFGSALNNFGVEPFLSALTDLAPPPAARRSGGRIVEPTTESFSAFVFKIQANMDPKHRDRMAFMRVCSGRFRKDMLVHHARLDREIRMTRPHRLFARDRETVEEALPGDVVGVVNPGVFVIGDTVSEDASVRFDAIPKFEPECFAVIRSVAVDKSKRFHRGMKQLEEEGAIQLLVAADGGRRDVILAAVGELQFDVVVSRLESEYGVMAAIERLPYVAARWVVADPAAIENVLWPYQGVPKLHDGAGRLVVLFRTLRDVDYCVERNPKVEFRRLG